MARNLSKISAVISVNTQEARQQLAGFAGDATKYAKSLDSSFQNTSKRIQSSFENIWTAQQRIQRQLQAGMQAGVKPEVLRSFADTKALEAEAAKIIELRKRAMGMMTSEGQNLANADIDKIAAAFTKLNDILVRTGQVSPKALKALRQGIAAVGASVGGIQQQDARLGTAAVLRKDFSRGSTDQWFESQNLSVAIKQMEAYRRILRQLKAENDAPLRSAFDKMAKAQAKAASVDPVDKKKLAAARAEVERTRKEFEKLAAAMARTQGGAARNLRSAGGIRNMVDQATTGSVNSDWGTRTGLAIQQLTFAFDDFNSATGGLDAKIRAMGNNISQLGLIAGGTAGLIGGVLVGAAAQLYASYLKLTDATTDTAAITKNAAKAEQELTAARQKQADILKQLREDLATAGMTDEQKRIFGSEQKGGEFLAAAVEEQRATLMRDDPVLRRAGARIAQLEKQMENPTMGAAERRKVEGQIAQQRAIQEGRLADLRGPNDQDPVAEFRKLEGFYKEMGGDTGYLDYLKPMIDQINQAIAQGMGGPQLEALIANAVANAVPDPTLLPRTGMTEMMIDYLDGVAAAASANMTRRRLATQEENAGMIPVFDQGAQELNRVMGTVSQSFGNMIPEQYLATIEDIREEMKFVEKQLADGAINADQAAAEMERLNGEMANVSATARQAAADLEGERKARNLLADMQIDAFNREQEAKKQFYEQSDMFSTERAMENVRRFNLGARQTDGVTDDQAREETLAMMMREFAPAILQLANARENSLLQGANMATLQMQDTSTTGGAAEYARLVSGEDSAKNADLVELRKQSALLGELVQQAENEGIL